MLYGHSVRQIVVDSSGVQRLMLDFPDAFKRAKEKVDADAAAWGATNPSAAASFDPTRGANPWDRFFATMGKSKKKRAPKKRLSSTKRVEAASKND